MKNKRLTAMLLTALMIKAIIKGSYSPNPFDTVEIFLLDMESITNE